MPQTCNLIQALMILDPDGRGFVEADHDVIYLPSPEPDHQPAVVEGEESRHLAAVPSCFWSEEHESWVMYA